MKKDEKTFHQVAARCTRFCPCDGGCGCNSASNSTSSSSSLGDFSYFSVCGAALCKRCALCARGRRVDLAEGWLCLVLFFFVKNIYRRLHLPFGFRSAAKRRRSGEFTVPPFCRRCFPRRLPVWRTPRSRPRRCCRPFLAWAAPFL